MRTVTVSHNWYSFPQCSGIAVPTVFGVPSDVSCRDQGRACRAWSGLVGMEAELGHSLTVHSLQKEEEGELDMELLDTTKARRSLVEKPLVSMSKSSTQRWQACTLQW